MTETLHTLAGECRHEVTIKKSRFLAQAAPVADTRAALEVVSAVGADDANHNCWAYRVGQQYRFSDDGEPSGSAGKPILAAIDGQSLDGVVAVVTRWFGGIKLGVGGLMRAYGGTAAEAMRQAECIPIVATSSLILECDYAALPLLKARMAAMEPDIRDEQYGASAVTLSLELPDEHIEALRQLVADVTHGAGTLALRDV